MSDTQLTFVFPSADLLFAGTHTLTLSNIEDPHIVSFGLTVVNPQLGSTVNNGGIFQLSNTNVGRSSLSSNVTYTNLGNVPLQIDSVSLSGPNSSAFTIPIAGASCPLQGITLAAMGTCLEAIIFTPPAAGDFTATLTVNFEAPGSPWIITLAGTGVGVPAATIAPLSLNFGDLAVGASSAPQSFTITNTGSGSLTIASIQVPQPGYTSTNNCLSTLGLGASCTVNITFAPLTVRNFGANVTVIASDGSHVIQLAADAVGVPVAAIAPTGIDFGSQTIGTSSAAQGVIVASAGTGSLQIASITLSNTADFQMVSNCSQNLAPNTNCSLAVTFAPSHLGSLTGTATITSSDGGSPHVIQLSGTGTGFALAPGPGSTSSVNVPAGQTASFQLSLSPQAFTGSVTLTCTPVTAIPNATCAVSPNPVTLSGTPSTVTVTLTTVAHTSGIMPGFERLLSLPGPFRPSISLWTLLLALISLTVAFHKWRRIPAAVLTTTLLAILMAGCASGGGTGGGGGGSNPPPGGGGTTGTPAGTYQLLVTAAGSGVSTSTTLTVVVQ